MQKGIAIMSNVHKRGVETRQYLSYSADKNVADRVSLVALVTVKLNELTAFQQGDFHLTRDGIYDQFFAHAGIRLAQKAILICQSSRPSNGSLLLVTIFAQSLLSLVGRHFMTLAFFTARHDVVIYSFAPTVMPDSNLVMKSWTRLATTVSGA